MKARLLIVTMAIAMMMASCCGNPAKIDSKQITKLYNEKLTELCLDKVYTTIDTGYYELNDPSQRYVLQQLAHAGVIEYNVERFAWFNKCTDIKNTVTKVIEFYCEDSGDLDHTQNVYGKGEVISYELEEHFMVEVRIKRKYKSMLVDALPQPNIEDKELAAPLYKAWPEDELKNNEEWPEMVAPKIPEPPVERKDIKCQAKKETPKQQQPARKQEVQRAEKKPRCVSIDPATTKRYQDAKMAEAQGEVHILAYEVGAVLTRNIQIFNTEDKSLAARCEVIVQSKKVTPQGHILNSDIINGIPAKVDITLTYFVDKGWVIDAKEGEFAKPEINPAHVIRENLNDEPEE